MARNLGIECADNQPYYFISYNTEDAQIVSKYVKCLGRFDIPIWYDRGIKIGAEWEREIAEKIEGCQAVIMFISKNIFLKSDSYVHKEYELATQYSRKSVYVIMLDEIEKPNVPLHFRLWWSDITRFQCVNAFEYDSANECVQMFIDEILPQNEHNFVVEIKEESKTSGARNRNEQTNPGVDEVKRFIQEKLLKARADGLKTITIKSGDIHKEMNLSSRMPTVCGAMYKLQTEKDAIIERPPKGKGSRLIIEYFLDK